MKLLMENWKKFVNEQPIPQQAPAEQQPGAAPAEQQPGAAPAEQQPEAPEGSGLQLTDQTSFKVFAGKPELAAKVMNELLQGGDLFKQLQQAQTKTKDDGSVKGQWFQIKSPEALKQWVAGIGGVKVFAQRAAAIGAKIPAQGLPKSKMPFLPLPHDPESAAKDPADVEDALTPGGKYNIDMMEKMPPPEVNTLSRLDQDPNAAKFMRSGLDDGNPTDDVIKIELGGSMTAAEAIPTQTNILFPKGLGMAVNGDATIQNGGPLGAYASTNNEILDGHHRWAAVSLNKPDASLGTLAKIDLTALGTDETLKYLTAIGNALGNKAKVK